MSILIRDEGFTAEDWPFGFVENRREISGDNGAGLTLGAEADVSQLHSLLEGLGMIRVVSDSFADGRVFTIARRLRLMGFKGRLRLSGPIIADQYAMARRAGFDEVEISDAQAARQPEGSWRFRSDWRANNYQARLRGE